MVLIRPRGRERWYERPDAVSIFHNSFGRSPAQPEEACLCRGRGRGAAGAGALGLSREAPPARRARPMTPGDIQNGRVGPDPTAGAKTVAGAPRAQNTDPRPRNVPNRNHSGQRCAALATVFDPAVGSGPTRPFWISPGVIGRARCAGVASLLSPNAPTPGPRRQLSHIAYSGI